ncbi:MAG: T9SS C-terminal target domain-containing protein [Chitinophagia bacterium]|nr:T9SS C-terminal target domain-containing protein [Chitinophagia bacterium]
MAYKRYDNTSDDKLEVVYSTDCGANWTSIWSKSGTTLETVTPPATGSFTPSAASYKLKSVDVSSVPAGAILGFRGTSDYGNNIWIDDINLRAGTPAAISNVNEATARDISVYPNPAHTEATLSFEMSNAGEANVYVADQLGRVVTTISTGNLTAGTHTFTIATASLAAGIYHVVVNTSTATNTLQLSVVK